MAIKTPNERGIDGDTARKAFIYGLEKVLKEKVDPESIKVMSDESGAISITETNFEIQCVVTGKVPKKPRAPRKAKAAA